MGSVSTSNLNLSQFYKTLERASELDSLMDRIDDSKYVLLGEKSMGFRKSQIIKKNTNTKFLKNKPEL